MVSYLKLERPSWGSELEDCIGSHPYPGAVSNSWISWSDMPASDLGSSVEMGDRKETEGLTEAHPGLVKLCEWK